MNSQLPIALHVLGFLASQAGKPLTSDVLAQTYGTSPVVLRRVLAKLQRAGLIATRRGVGGGSVLARDPSTINLREAYEAVTDHPRMLSRHPGDTAGGVASVVSGYLDELFDEAEQALLVRLEAVTVAKMDKEIRARFRAQGSCDSGVCD